MEKIKSYKKTIEYLFQKLPMYQREGTVAYKKDLTNTLKLCAIMDNPQDKLKTIHIAGTNGKGTTSHIIAAGLQAQGYKVGVYTSPHYKDFRERIKINGRYIELKYITDFINTYHEPIESIQPSFFEITVALAFAYFADQNVDYAVIETGLGGRLDSTNIILPILSVITNISLDHENLLGDTLEEIAGEKAGIIKSGIPVIIGETQKSIEHVFLNKAKHENTVIYFADQELQFKVLEETPFLILQMYLNHQVWRKPLITSLSGPFQSKNIVSGIYALHFLSNLISIDMNKVWSFMKEMTQNTAYLGRWQTLGNQPLIITDSAHNEGGFSLVIERLMNIPHEKLHIVLGFVNDKTLDKILNLFPHNATYYWTKANIPRGLNADLLSEKGQSFGLKGKSYFSVRKALAAAKTKADSKDLIYVGGSIFVVAEVI